MYGGTYGISELATKTRTTEKVGQESCGEQALKLNRGEVTKGLMNPEPVIEQQVSGNRVRGLLAGLEMSIVDTLYLDRFEERFGTGIVVGRTRAAHALDAADRRDLAPEVP